MLLKICCYFCAYMKMIRITFFFPSNLSIIFRPFRCVVDFIHRAISTPRPSLSYDSTWINHAKFPQSKIASEIHWERISRLGWMEMFAFMCAAERRCALLDDNAYDVNMQFELIQIDKWICMRDMHVMVLIAGFVSPNTANRANRMCHPIRICNHRKMKQKTSQWKFLQ